MMLDTGLERLCRYVLRPPFAQAHMRLRGDGCHGVLAPRARWRRRAVAYGRVGPEPTASAAPLAPGPDGTRAKPNPRAWSWAALMHRAFAIDVLACPAWGGRLRLIATLHDPAVIRKILAHLGFAHSRQSPGPAHPSPAPPRPDPSV
jgi:hypothetical protein